MLVYADLPAAQPLRLTIGGQPVAASGALAPAPRPLLERAWVKARLARLMSQRDAASASDPDLAEALRKQVIELSVRHRVLSPFTALLVLETENDYRRFGIERRALADILTVGPAGWRCWTATASQHCIAGAGARAARACGAGAASRSAGRRPWPTGVARDDRRARRRPARPSPTSKRARAPRVR